MADLSKIKVNNIEYNLKDTVARQNIPHLVHLSIEYDDNTEQGIITADATYE